MLMFILFEDTHTHNGEEGLEEGDICIPIADSLHCTAETNTTW